MSAPDDPIPAATLILMRPGPAAPELLVMERTARMAFAAGAIVFPGGRVDPEDHALAAQVAPGLEDAAARIAAIRETIEETGIAPALLPAPSPATAAALRARMAEGESFGASLAEMGLTLDLEAMTPFARWCPNFKETRRFDALFYVAEAAAHAPEPSAQAGEAEHVFWATADYILSEADAGQVHIIFPTRRNLERLARFASFDAARADALAHPVQRITPWVEQRGGEDWLCIPEDAGYPVTAERMETVRRG